MEWDGEDLWEIAPVTCAASESPAYVSECSVATHDGFYTLKLTSDLTHSKVTYQDYHTEVASFVSNFNCLTR
jgi:hypothetical protein